MSRPLTASQRIMLRCSASDPRAGTGSAVPLRTAGNWHTARALERRGLGTVIDPQAAFHANRAGIAAVAAMKGPS